MGKHVRTSADFIKKAQGIHGKKYDYSQSVYRGSETALTIACSIHGPFEQKPCQHLAGRGCQKCGVKAAGRYPAVDTKSFVEKATARHAGRYAYSRSTYQNAVTKLIITCPEHGDFLQAPGQHLIGKGCAKCANKTKALAAQLAVRKWDTESVRVKAKELHPTLNFSRFVYFGYEAPSIVICSVHGEMRWTPHKILAGHGCSQCHCESQRGQPRTSLNHQLNRFSKAHGAKYDYSLIPDVFLADDKLAIICPEHGVFEQVGTSHASGAGCPTCAIAKTAERMAKGAAYFLERFRIAHGSKYDYSQAPTSFFARDKISILCPTHGIFTITADSHAAGHGCRKCGNKRISIARTGRAYGWGMKQWIERAKGREATLYLLKIQGNGEYFFKIGITINFERRFRNKGTMPYEFELIDSFRGAPELIAGMEQRLKERFKSKKHRPALAFAGRSECYAADSRIAAAFPDKPLPTGRRPSLAQLPLII